MSEFSAEIQGIGPTHIGLEVFFEAPDLKRSEAIRRLLALGNPLLDTDGDRLISVDQVERVGEVKVVNGLLHPHPEADDGEFVWACDHCGSYSVSQAITVQHEKTCPSRKDI